MTLAPTATAPGTISFPCVRCGTIIRTEAIPILPPAVVAGAVTLATTPTVGVDTEEATTENNAESTTITDNQVPLASAPTEDDDHDDATTPSAGAGTDDAIVVIENEDVPLAPGDTDGGTRSLLPLVLGSIGVVAVSATGLTIILKRRKLVKF